MARKKQLLSQDELDYQQMAKRANQRALRLERYFEDNPEAPTAGLDLYNFYLHSDYGDTRKRFPENPKQLSAEQLQVYSVQLSNFLSFDLSQKSAVKKYEEIYKTYKETVKQKPVKGKPLEGEDKKLAKRVAGIEGKVLKNGEKITDSKMFFDAVNAMYHFKFTKVMGYRDIMRIVSSVQNRSRADIMVEIANIAGEMAAKKKITYREIRKRIRAVKLQEGLNK